MKEVRNRCIAAIERKIEYYWTMNNAEDRLSAWYLVTGYIEAMLDAGIIDVDEYRSYNDMLEKR